MTAGWKRLWVAPRRASGGGLLDPLTPKQRYLVDQSLTRYHRRPDAYPPGRETLPGELGTIDSFRFVITPVDHFLDAAAYTVAALLPAVTREAARDRPPMLITTPGGYDDQIGRLYQAARDRDSSYVVFLHADEGMP